MADGVEDFEIKEMQIIEGSPGWAIGSVVFGRPHTLTGGVEVSDTVTIKVRAILPADGTIASLREALYRQAAETLAHTVARCADKSAAELIADAHDRAVKEREKALQW